MSATAFLDANVLYKATTRSVLMYLAVGGLFRARWSTAVQDEWARNLLRNRSDINPQDIARTRTLMEKAIPDAIVTGYEPLISTLTLPDSGDRHVLAAAIHGGASIIVTENLNHFPAAALSPHSIVAKHPDIFIRGLLDADLQTAVDAFAKDRAGMAAPPMTPEEYLTALDCAGLVATVAALRDNIDQL